MRESFLKYLQFEKRVSLHTIKSYKNDLNQFFEFYKNYAKIDNLKEVDKRAIRSWVIELSLKNLSNRTINRKIASLKSFFKFLIQRKITIINPTSNIHALKTNQPLPHFIKEKDIKYLFDNITFKNDFNGNRDLLILELLYGTGIRISELINLKTKDLDNHKKEIKVLGKRGKERIIPLNNSAFAQAIKYEKFKEKLNYKNKEYLLCTEKGEKIYPMLISRVVKNNLSSLINSEKYNPHLLRHTFATHILNKGADLNSIKELLGHESLAATQVYTHNSIEKLKTTFRKSHPKA